MTSIHAAIPISIPLDNKPLPHSVASRAYRAAEATE